MSKHPAPSAPEHRGSFGDSDDLDMSFRHEREDEESGSFQVPRHHLAASAQEEDLSEVDLYDERKHSKNHHHQLHNHHHQQHHHHQNDNHPRHSDHQHHQHHNDQRNSHKPHTEDFIEMQLAKKKKQSKHHSEAPAKRMQYADGADKESSFVNEEDHAKLKRFNSDHPSKKKKQQRQGVHYDEAQVRTEEGEVHIPKRKKLTAGRMTYRQRNPNYPQLTRQPTEKSLPLTYRITSTLMGYAPEAYSSHAYVPKGYSVRHTRRGYAFLVPEATESRSSSSVDMEAAYEHRLVHVAYSATREDLGDIYGVGIYIFFDFVRYLVFANIALFVIAMVHFLAHLSIDGASVPSPDSWHWMYTGDYSSGLVAEIWRYTNIVIVALWFLCGPVYSARVTRYYVQNQIDDMDDGFIVDDIILTNEKYGHRILRMIVSYFVFLVCLGVAMVITYFAVKVQAQSDLNSLVTSGVVAALVSLMNVGYNFFAVFMTRFERHMSWSSFRSHSTFKYFAFKLGLTIAMYIWRYWIETKADDCDVGSIGDQFLLLLVVDVLLVNFLDIVQHFVLWRYGKLKGRTSTRSNEAEKPEFDVADQYLQVLYRQFVIFLGMPIFPWLPLIGAFCHFVDYVVSKFVLIKYCQQTYYLRGSMKKFLTFYLFTVAALAVLSFPFGAVWVLTDYTRNHCHSGS